MLELIYSIICLIILFFVTAFILVKLYEHGVRIWFVQTVLVLFGAYYVLSKPYNYIFSSTEKWIALTITLACIFVIDKGSSNYKPKAKAKPLHSDSQVEESQNNSSFFHHALDFLMIYSIWSYLTSNDENDC